MAKLLGILQLTKDFAKGSPLNKFYILPNKWDTQFTEKASPVFHYKNYSIEINADLICIYFKMSLKIHLT